MHYCVKHKTDEHVAVLKIEYVTHDCSTCDCSELVTMLNMWLTCVEHMTAEHVTVLTMHVTAEHLTVLNMQLS